MSRLVALSLACSIIAASVSVAHAANRTWTAAVSGDFSDATEWTGGVPGSGDSATFNTAGTYTITFDNNPNPLPNPVLNQDLAVAVGNVTFTSGAGGPYMYRLTGAGGDDAIIIGGSLTLGTSGNPLNLVVDDALQIRGNATLLANFGSDITARDLILSDSTPPAGNGTLTVDGQDSVLTVTASAQLGMGGTTGTLTLRNKATADFGGTLGLADNTSAMSSAGVLNVHSGAAATTSHIRLGPNAIAGQTGTIDVGNGNGLSTVTQDTNATLVIGAASAGADTGILLINDGGVFNSGGGTGTVTINQSGRVTVSTGGTLNLNGDTTVDGGMLDGGGVVNIAASRRLTLQNDALLDFDNDVEFNGATVNVNSGSDLRSPSTIDFGRSGGTMTVRVDGMGSLVSAGSFGGTWGDNGSTANVTIRNGGRATVNGGGIRLAQSATAGTAATVNIESGGLLQLIDADLVVADDGGGIGTITVSGAGSQVLQLVGSITLGHASTGSATINVNTGGTFRKISGGNITVNRTGQINIAGGTLELGGIVIVDGGSITRTSGIFNISGTLGAQNDAQINLGAGFDSALLQGRNFQINSGADLIFGDGLALASVTITVDGAGSSLVMPGESVLSNNARITIRNSAGAELGPIVFGPGSVVTVDGGTVEMNILTDNGGTIDFLAGSLRYVGDLVVGTGGLLGESLTLESNRELTLSGTTTIDAGHALTLVGGSLSTGSLAVNGTFNFDSGRLAITGGAGLTIGAGGPLGAGVLLGQDSVLEVDNTLTILSGAMLFAESPLNVGSAVVRSGGRMYANGGFAAGSVHIASGGQLFLSSARPDFGAGLINNGDLVFSQLPAVNGAVTNAGAVTALADVTFNDLVNGAGGFYGAGTVTFDGGFSPGASPAAVSFEGDVVFSGNNTLVIEIGGTRLGVEHDSLQIDGQATLDGELDVSLINGFSPSVDNSFEVLHANGGIFGTFATTSLPTLAAGLDWSVVYSNFAVILQVAAIDLLGDYNQDGVVDAADYVVWRKTDGNQAGYDLWRAHFGETVGGSGANSNAAVPEPTPLILMIVAAMGISARRHRNA